MKLAIVLFLALFVAQYAPPKDTKLESSALIAGEDEPGTRMVIRGVVFAADGETPVEGVIVHAYQTDNKGHYDAAGNNPSRDHRLKAWVKTDAEGRYKFRTIRPAHYPQGGVPAHVHYVLMHPDGGEQKIDLYFVGDPYLREGHRATEGPQEDSLICPAEPGEDGVIQITADLQLRG